MGRKERWLYLSVIIVAGMVGGAAMSLLLQSGTAFGATHHRAKHSAIKTVKARDLILVDDAGNKRAELHIVNSEPALDMYGPDGKMRISLAVTAKGLARARFYNANGGPQAAIGVTPDGRPGMALLNKDRKLRAAVEVSTEGAPALRFYGNSGPLLGLTVTPEGLPGIVLLNNGGKTMAALDVNHDGQSSLTLYNAEGNVAAGLP